jgi:hypothetical protein
MQEFGSFTEKLHEIGFTLFYSFSASWCHSNSKSNTNRNDKTYRTSDDYRPRAFAITQLFPEDKQTTSPVKMIPSQITVGHHQK